MDLYQVSDKVRSQTMIVSQKSFNSYPGQPCCNGQWTEGDIAHFPGQGAAERDKYMEHYLEKVRPTDRRRVLEHGCALSL